MRAHEVYVEQLNKTFPVFAPNVFDAAIFVLSEQEPNWQQAMCRVKHDDEFYFFRATRHQSEVTFDFGEEYV